jgi:hypothetical protein
MRFRFRGSYSCGEQFECKGPVSASQGRVLSYRHLNSKSRDARDTMLHEDVVSRLGRIPARALCVQFWCPALRWERR